MLDSSRARRDENVASSRLFGSRGRLLGEETLSRGGAVCETVSGAARSGEGGCRQSGTHAKLGQQKDLAVELDACKSRREEGSVDGDARRGCEMTIGGETSVALSIWIRLTRLIREFGILRRRARGIAEEACAGDRHRSITAVQT